MRNLAKQIGLFWSHDDTGYLVNYFHLVLGLDHNEIKSLTESKLIKYSEYSYEVIVQTRVGGLLPISKHREELKMQGEAE